MTRVKKKYLTPLNRFAIIKQVCGCRPVFASDWIKKMDDTERLVEQGMLYDFYGPLLTKHQQKIYEEVVYENLSLNEIADLEGISKQAVHDLIRRTTGILKNYEEKLGMLRKFEIIRTETEKLRENADDSRTGSELAAYMVKAADRIDEDLK